MSGRCIGFPKNSCHAYSDYADAKMKGWMCKKCKEKDSLNGKVKMFEGL